MLGFDWIENPSWDRNPGWRIETAGGGIPHSGYRRALIIGTPWFGGILFFPGWVP